MQLTNRQCWDIIRSMVKQKNEEYTSFLYAKFGDDAKTILGSTKTAFLSSFDIEEVGKNWLNDLSSEDLLIFLDFRCRILQKMYDHYKTYNTIHRSNIKVMIHYNRVTGVALYNGGNLQYTGRPKAEKGEENIQNADVDINKLREQALAQVMGSMAYKYAYELNVTLDYATKKIKELQTSNITNQGRHTGYEFKGEVKVPKNLLVQAVEDRIKSSTTEAKQEEIKPTSKDNKVNNIDTASSEPKMTMAGFTESGVRVFECNGEYMDFFGNKLELDKLYDIDDNLIKVVGQTSNNLDEIMDAKLKGFDIQGSPVYEKDGVYYSSTGKRLSEDVFIDTAYNI